MDLSSSTPESQSQQRDRLQNHDHQSFPTQPTHSYYYHHENQQHQLHYSAYDDNGTRPPHYHLYHQLPYNHQNLQPPGVSVNSVPQIVDSVWRMAQVGLNPVAAAAVVALSQLAQSNGKSTARVLQPPHHGPTLMPTSPPASGSPYSVGGRGGSGSLRDDDGGCTAQCLPKTGDHGTGSSEGRCGPPCFEQYGVNSAPQKEPCDENAKPTYEAKPSAVLPKVTTQTTLPPVASQSTPTAEKTSSSRRPPQGGWCELCRVECTSLRMLEEHKNGKKHQRKLLRTKESKIVVKPGIQKRNEKKPAAKPDNEGSQQPSGAQDSEKPKQEINGQKHIEASMQETPSVDCFDSQRCGMKRKMPVGQGGDCTKTLDDPGHNVGPCKRKVVFPHICDLCNVRCNNQPVLDDHLSGKKHTALFNRFGPAGLQVLYPSDSTVQNQLPPQGNQQPLRSLQGSNSAAEIYMPPQTPQAATIP